MKKRKSGRKKDENCFFPTLERENKKKKSDSERKNKEIMFFKFVCDPKETLQNDAAFYSSFEETRVRGREKARREKERDAKRDRRKEKPKQTFFPLSKSKNYTFFKLQNRALSPNLRGFGLRSHLPTSWIILERARERAGEQAPRRAPHTASKMKKKNHHTLLAAAEPPPNQPPPPEGAAGAAAAAAGAAGAAGGATTLTSAGLAAGAAAGAAGAAAAGFAAAAAAAAGFAAPVSASAAAGFLLNHEEIPLAGLGSSFFLNQLRTLSLPVDESTMKRAKTTPVDDDKGKGEGVEKKVRERKNLAVGFGRVGNRCIGSLFFSALAPRNSDLLDRL